MYFSTVKIHTYFFLKVTFFENRRIVSDCLIVTLVLVVKSVLAIRFFELSRCLRISFRIKMFRFGSVLVYLRKNAFGNRIVRV